jgi:hypothetical protein
LQGDLTDLVEATVDRIGEVNRRRVAEHTDDLSV